MGNILLSKIDWRIKDTDSLQNVLINYWIINEHVEGACVPSREFNVIIDFILFNSSSVWNEQKNSPIYKKNLHHTVLF